MAKSNVFSLFAGRMATFLCLGARVGLSMTLMAASLATSATAASAPDAEFDFSYTVSGDATAQPIQVFDDGRGKTFFQFRSGTRVPVILDSPNGRMLMTAVEGAYHTVPGLRRDYHLQLGRASARVRHLSLVDGSSVAANDVAEATPTRRPIPYRASDRTGSSYASPTRGDVIAWVEPAQRSHHAVTWVSGAHMLDPRSMDAVASHASRHGPSARVRIVRFTGRRQGTAPDDEAVRHALEQAGVAAASITSETHRTSAASTSVRLHWMTAPATPESPSPADSSHDMALVPDRTGPSVSVSGRPLRSNFDLLTSDRTISAALRRWADRAGYRLAWNTTIDAPITGEVTVAATRFPEAVAEVVSGLQASGYPVRLEPGDDRTLKVSQRP